MKYLNKTVIFVILIVIFYRGSCTSVLRNDVDVFSEPSDCQKMDRIMNGALANEAMFPYLVSIQSSSLGQHLCGGILLTSFHILTAAHCMFLKTMDKQLSPKDLQVRKGPSNLRLPGKVLARVQWIKIHEDYKLKPIDNDIAIIKVDKSLSSSITDIPCLSTSYVTPLTVSGSCIAVGWGRLGPDPAPIESKTILLDTSLMSNHTFNSTIHSYNISSQVYNETENVSSSVHYSINNQNASFSNISFPSTIAPNTAFINSSSFHNESVIDNNHTIYNISSQVYNETHNISSSFNISINNQNASFSNISFPSTIAPNTTFINSSSFHNESVIGNNHTDHVFGVVNNRAKELTMRFTILPLQNIEECAKDYSFAGITADVICAGKRNSNTDTCKGDSGGPLICDNKIEGIVSFGDGCENPEHLGVYTRVYNHLNWIEKQINSGTISHNTFSLQFILICFSFYVYEYVF